MADAGKGPAFTDWAQLISFAPRLYYRPQDEAELRDLLTAVQRNTLVANRVRIPGGFHSCSDIVISDAILDVEALPRTMDFDPDGSAVTVSANWHLHEFLLKLSERGKSLTATGGTDAQTLPGLISTSTAPATMKASLYDLLEWVQYLCFDDGGAVVQRRATRGEPAFDAAVCSLGAIDVLTKVRFRLVDQLYFRTVQRIAPLKEMLGDLTATSAKFDFWRIDWIPETEKGLVWTAQQIPKAQADPLGDYKADQSEGILKFLFKHWDKIHAVGPLLDPVMKGVFEIMALLYGKTEATGPLRTMLPVDRRAPLHAAMAEWSFDPADLNRVLAECRTYFKNGGWPNLPIEIELSKTNSFLMSPWNWKGLSYVVKLNFMYLTDVCTQPGEKEGIYAHLKGLWDHLIKVGIPFKAHWGKLNFMDHQFVKAHFELDQFKPFIQPVSLNQYLRERLLPLPRPRRLSPCSLSSAICT